MAMTPEKKVKQAVVAILKEFKAYYFYPVSGGYGMSGVPDIVVCFLGRFIGIECKAGTNKPTALQEVNLNNIREQGGIALVINEDNIQLVRKILTAIQQGTQT